MSRAVVLRALGLGDVLAGVPALRALRASLAGWRIELLAPERFAPLLGDLVDAVVDAPPFVLEALDHVAPHPDLAVNLHGRGPQSTARLHALRPGRLVAFGIDAEWDDAEHERVRWCRLLRSSGVAPDADPEALALSPPVAGPRPSPYAGSVVIHPGAASAARRWPVDRFAAVAAALRADGYPVVITGGPDERPLARQLAAEAGIPASGVLAGRTSLVSLAAAVADAALVVCGDTGVAHLATAYGTPSVVLFGPTPPAQWGPPTGSARHRVLWAGRSGDPHGTVVDAGLLSIEVDPVVDAARSVLSGA